MTRLLSRLVLTVLVLGVLLIGADRGAALLAARAVSQRLQNSLRTPMPPTITIAGVPFLTQAVAGRYRTVDVALSDLPSGNGLVVQRIDAILEGVHAPLQQALTGALGSVPVDHAGATVHVTFGALETSADSRLAGQGVHVTLSRVDARTVAVTATLSSVVGRFTATGRVRLSVTRGRLVVTVDASSLSGIPPALRDVVGRQFSGSVVTPALPFQLSISSVTVDSSGLSLIATGSNVTLG